MAMYFDDGGFGGAEHGLSMPLGDFMAFLESEPPDDGGFGGAEHGLSMPLGDFMAFLESEPADDGEDPQPEAKKVSKKSPTIRAKNEKKHSPTIICHLFPSRQPSQIVETLERVAEKMEEANLDVRHKNNASILTDKNQAQPRSLSPTVDSSRDDHENRASVHDGSCGANASAGSLHTASVAGSPIIKPLAYTRKKRSTPPELIPSGDESDEDDFILPRCRHKKTHKEKAFISSNDDDFILPRRVKHREKAVKAKKVSKKSPTIPGKNEKKKHSPTISCHLFPSRQPSQTVETLDTAAEMMEEANLDVRHKTNDRILPGKNQAQSPFLPPTVDSSRDDLDNRASVHGGSCGGTTLAQLTERAEFDGTGRPNKTPIAAHGEIHTKQGSAIITTNANRTHRLPLEEECRIAPDSLGQQLRSNGPSSVPPAQSTEGMQVALDNMERNRVSPLTTEKGDRSAEKVRVQRAGVEISFLNCRICFRPLKPPVFQCNGGHLACGTCLAELPGGQCPMCKHSGGFVPSLAVDDIVSSAMIKCSHNGCQSYVTYHELEDHHRACPHAPCFCTEPGCGFGGPPLALLGHLAALHSWPVHKIEYGKVLGLQVPVSEPRRLLLAKEDGRGFLLVVGELSAITAVSVVCIRAGASLLPQYRAVMRAYGPPAVADIRCMVDTEAVTSSSRPHDVDVEKVPFVLLVPPTHVFGAGASKEVSLKIRINKK